MFINKPLFVFGMEQIEVLDSVPMLHSLVGENLAIMHQAIYKQGQTPIYKYLS